MIRTAMHKRSARMPTYISSVEDESGSRASPAAVLLLLCFYSMKHTPKMVSVRDRETRTGTR